MGRDTNIAWTDATANESFGCRMVDRACGIGVDINVAGCYMFRIRKTWGQKGTDIVRFNLENLSKRIKSWPADKRKVFLDDMTDLFGEFNSFDHIERVHKVVIEANPDRELQLLTKRIGRAMVFYRKRPVPKNVWIGCSIGERPRLKRLEQLRQIPAKIRFVSFEPLIEDLGEFDLTGIQWAIVGGESGTGPRPMAPEWAENILGICRRDHVAFFFKQMGGKGGDGAGGDLLNGRQIKEFPNGF